MKKLIPVYVRVPLIFAIVFGAMEYFIDSGDQPAFIKFPMVGLFLAVFLFLLIAIEIVSSAVDNITYHLLTEEQKKQLDEAQSVSFTESTFYKSILNKLTRTKAIEQEADVMLDHNYDGIRELDNVLPPWWVYLFYGTIIFGAIYLVRFEIMGYNNQDQEYQAEVKQAKIDIAEYMKTAPDMMSKEKVTLLTDASSLAAGKAIYTTNCVACHRPDGGGQIGPNLTDTYWILGGGIKNVFNTIMEGGRDGKGMVSWKASIKPSDIQKVASYVLSMQGTNPKDAKPMEPEAVEWKEETVAASLDTTKVAVK
ncbi:MAG: c-type cytochrome [Flavobacterium sp.]|nr:c-type cytochrome [Flavobacterium sp.]